MMLIQLNSQLFKSGYIWRTVLYIHLRDCDTVMGSFHSYHSFRKRQGQNNEGQQTFKLFVMLVFQAR